MAAATTEDWISVALEKINFLCCPVDSHSQLFPGNLPWRIARFISRTGKLQECQFSHVLEKKQVSEPQVFKERNKGENSVNVAANANVCTCNTHCKWYEAGDCIAHKIMTSCIGGRIANFHETSGAFDVAWQTRTNNKSSKVVVFGEKVIMTTSVQFHIHTAFFFCLAIANDKRNNSTKIRTWAECVKINPVKRAQLHKFWEFYGSGAKSSNSLMCLALWWCRHLSRALIGKTRTISKHNQHSLGRLAALTLSLSVENDYFKLINWYLRSKYHVRFEVYTDHDCKSRWHFGAGLANCAKRASVGLLPDGRIVQSVWCCACNLSKINVADLSTSFGMNLNTRLATIVIWHIVRWSFRSTKRALFEVLSTTVNE